MKLDSRFLMLWLNHLMTWIKVKSFIIHRFVFWYRYNSQEMKKYLVLSDEEIKSWKNASANALQWIQPKNIKLYVLDTMAKKYNKQYIHQFHWPLQRPAMLKMKKIVCISLYATLSIARQPKLSVRDIVMLTKKKKTLQEG